MEGVITSFSGTTLVVNVDSIGGSGTYANWTISVAGIQGSNGVTSITGTANQVIASASTGAVTLSLPQDIATTSSPTFVGTNFSGTATSLSIGGNAATASKWATARNLAGNSVDGSANVAFANKFIVQGTTDTGLTGAQFLGALGTGIVKNTTSTGVLSIEASGTDYAPATSGSAILYGNGSGGFSSVTIGTGVSFTAGTLSATGSGGTVTSVGFTGGLITVATASTTPAFTVAGTSGGIPYFSSASTWATSAALALNSLVIGGGAGLAPATTTTGTGVLTALGTNVGSAGAFVTFNGALGTPSSGTVTNLTGTASININGTVGATTANTGAFTNLSYTGTLTGSTGILNIGSGQVYKDASGNVGIGTTTSLSRLTALGTTSTVSNGASTRNPIASIRGGNDNNRLDFYVDNSGATAIMGLGAYNTAGAGTAMAFYTGASASESMRIDSSGNVGIGTASPSGKLDLYNSNFGGDNTLLYLSSVNSASAKINYAGLGYEVSQGAAGIEAGAMIFRTYGSGALTERMRIDSSGNLLVGTTSATAAPNNGAQLIGGSIGALSVGHASGTATGNYFASFAYAGAVIGTITQNLTTGVLYNVSSDQRLKTNIQPAGSAIQSILDFPVDQFDWLSDGSHQDFGGIAQKILKVIPEMVSVPENPEEMMGVDWSKAVPRLIKTIQELNARLTKAGI
jgi:hypothetical protein